MALYSVYRVSEKHQVQNFWAAWLAKMANFTKKINVWMKTSWINIFTLLKKLARIFVFFFYNSPCISIYCLRIYKMNGFIWFHTGLKGIELFYKELFWQAHQTHRRKCRSYFETMWQGKNNWPIRGVKQKQWFKTKNKWLHYIKVGNGPLTL